METKSAPHCPGVMYGPPYSYDGIESFLRQCEAGAGAFVKIGGIGVSSEGREILCAEITDPCTGGADEKPAYYMQANMHANEMAGTNAVLQTMHDLLCGDRGRKLLAEVAFYMVPRANPDGAEYTISTGSELRSRLKILKQPNGVIPADIDGDGKILNMRWEDPDGPFAADREDSRIMAPRLPDDDGPFFQQHPEGLIHDYQGGPVGRSFINCDFNRNFPIAWNRKIDRADYPLQHPETRALADFLFSRKNIFAGLDLHCGARAILHGYPFSEPIETCDQESILQVGKIARDLTGIELMSARDWRPNWRPPQPSPGNMKDFAHFALGISFYTVEMGNIYNEAGISTEEIHAADNITRQRSFLRRVLEFSDEKKLELTRPVLAPWKDFKHPQLGNVQIGGLQREGTWAEMFYPEEIEAVSRKISCFALAHAALRPKLALSGFKASKAGRNVYVISGRLANNGFFPTSVMRSGLSAKTHQPVRAELDSGKGVSILSQKRVYEFHAIGKGEFQNLEWTVSAPPGTELLIRASHPRCGRITRSLALR